MGQLPELKIDNPVFEFMGKLGDLVILNLLWLVCCLPIITVGAATTALHAVARKMAAKEPYQVWRSFFAAFRENWGVATKLWLGLLPALILFLADLVAGYLISGPAGNLFRGIGMGFLVLWLLVCGFSFPMLARYHQSLKQIIVLSVAVAVRKFPVTVCYVLLVAFMPGLLLLIPELFAWLLLPWCLIFGALYAWLMAILLLPVQGELEKLGGNDHADPETETRL